MSKQEKIREGVAEIVRRDYKYNAHETIEEKTDRILEYLHSQGGVLKVDRELPKNPYSEVVFMHTTYKDTQEGMLKAGYVAVESLIEK